DGEGEMMDAADLGRIGSRSGLAILVGEDGDEAAVAGIEIEVALFRHVEIGLVEDEGHAEHAFPKVDRRLPVGADQRDVMDALGLHLLHRYPSTHLAATVPVSPSRRFISLRSSARRSSSACSAGLR